jgi:hypothetical protein
MFCILVTKCNLNLATLSLHTANMLLFKVNLG